MGRRRCAVGAGGGDGVCGVDGGVGGDVAQHEGVRADERVVADVDRAEQGGADAEDDPVADRGVPPGGLRVGPPASGRG
ncbi:hypothetical protein [Streptomyces mirabilis]|uniref:hypothetical protein n=1 Tax=Streptomyces mirabilis TaxID=68239 RepID=UPI00365A4476